MKERRALPDRRRLPLRPVPPPELPLLDGDEPPFLRPERRTRVRRARRGPLRRAILAVEVTGGTLVAGFLLWSGYARVMASDRLKVGRVDVRGSHFLSEGEVRELLGPAVGENILGLDIDSLKDRLRASPWVADATVARTLPDTLRVDIRERVPVALAELDRLHLMDGEGTLIDLYGPRTAGFDLPIVRGLMGVAGEARRERAQRAGTLLRDLRELGGELSEVEVEPSGDLRVVLRGRGELLRLGAPPYRQRLLTFLGLRGELAERCPDAEYFDLRFRDRIYAKPRVVEAGGKATPGAAAGARGAGRPKGLQDSPVPRPAARPAAEPILDPGVPDGTAGAGTRSKVEGTGAEEPAGTRGGR